MAAAPDGNVTCFLCGYISCTLRNIGRRHERRAPQFARLQKHGLHAAHLGSFSEAVVGPPIGKHIYGLLGSRARRRP